MWGVSGPISESSNVIEVVWDILSFLNSYHALWECKSWQMWLRLELVAYIYFTWICLEKYMSTLFGPCWNNGESGEVEKKGSCSWRQTYAYQFYFLEFLNFLYVIIQYTEEYRWVNIKLWRDFSKKMWIFKSSSIFHRCRFKIPSELWATFLVNGQAS